MLFKKNDKLLEYAELTGTIQFSSVKPTIRVVEVQHLVPVLGNELYKLLNDAYTGAADETSLPNIQKELLDKCRCLIGPMLCYYYAPKSEVKIGDAGAQRIETTTNKTAYQNQVTNFREQNLREAEIATELLLQFLEEKKDDYPLWVSSKAFKEYRSLFIKSGEEFNTFFSSSSPYRNYWAMRSKMLDVEENNIRTLLGDTLFDALKAKDTNVTADAYTDKEIQLLFKVKKVIAYLTVSFSIPFLNVRVDANGITVMNINIATNDNAAKRSAAGDPALNSIIEKSEAAARSWIKNVENYLKKNEADFVGNSLIDSNGDYLLVDSDGPLVPVCTTVVTDESNNGCFNQEQNGSFGLI